jgi:hypothetical protein
MKRVLRCLGPALLAAVLAGCSSNGLDVTLSGDTHQATASGVSCDPGSSSVTVSGSFTAGPGAIPRGQPSASIGPSATIYDSSRHQLGAFNGPDVSVRAKGATPFKFVVPVEAGSPASCALSWSGGPAPVIGE